MDILFQLRWGHLSEPVEVLYPMFPCSPRNIMVGPAIFPSSMTSLGSVETFPSHCPLYQKQFAFCSFVRQIMLPPSSLPPSFPLSFSPSFFHLMFLHHYGNSLSFPGKVVLSSFLEVETLIFCCSLKRSVWLKMPPRSRVIETAIETSIKSCHVAYSFHL